VTEVTDHPTDLDDAFTDDASSRQDDREARDSAVKLG
jgi:hypothetical protein